MRKLISSRGETLVETLVALLIATVVLGALATSVVVATNVNTKVQQSDTSFVYPDESKGGTPISIKITSDNGINSVGTGTATQYTDDSGQYTYYKGSE